MSVICNLGPFERGREAEIPVMLLTNVQDVNMFAREAMVL